MARMFERSRFVEWTADPAVHFGGSQTRRFRGIRIAAPTRNDCRR
jgi:hypothetical protein